MKVILLQDVPKIGRKNEVKNVADGHAVNFLIPRKLAVFATDEAMKRAKEAWQGRVEAEQLELTALRAALKDFSGKTIVVRAHANEKGHLFRGIDAEEIAKAIADQEKLVLHAKAIELERPIKEIGDRVLTIRAGGVSAGIVLSVQRGQN